MSKVNCAPILIFPESMHTRITVLGTTGPRWPRAPLDRKSCFHSGTNGFYKWWCKVVQRGRGRARWCGPQEISLPTSGQPHEGLTGRTGRLPSTVPANCAPGYPLIASQEGPGVRRRAANCLSPHLPTVRRGQSPILGTRTAQPAVILKGPGASQEVHQWSFWSHLILLPRFFSLSPS